MKMIAANYKRNCPLCGAAANRARPLAYGTDEFRVVQCEVCDIAFLDRLPPQQEFEDTRAWEVSRISHADQRKRDYPLLLRRARIPRLRFHLMSKREPKQILARLVQPGPV